MKLYEIAQAYQNIQNMDLEEEVLQDTLDALEGTLSEKADNITKLMKELEAQADARAQEANRLKDLADKDLKKVNALKEYLAYNLQAAGINKLDTGLFQLSFRKGSEVVELADETKAMATLMDIDKKKDLGLVVYKAQVSKTKVKELLKLGVEIPGVSLVRKPASLQIK